MTRGFASTANGFASRIGRESKKKAAIGFAPMAAIKRSNKEELDLKKPGENRY
jgi:hypothetical protein